MLSKALKIEMTHSEFVSLFRIFDVSEVLVFFCDFYVFTMLPLQAFYLSNIIKPKFYVVVNLLLLYYQKNYVNLIVNSFSDTIKLILRFDVFVYQLLLMIN